MRGGKRIGAGRKCTEESKRIRVPLGILNKVERLIEKYKRENEDKKTALEKRDNNQTPILTKEQLIIFQSVMLDFGYAKSKTQARKLTNTPQKCKAVFLDVVHKLSDNQFERLNDIRELYKVH
jgi:hypothetical protein